MSALTIRLEDEKYQRLKEIARRRNTSVNRLIDEMATQLLAESDAETRFALRTQRGRRKMGRGLELLEKARARAATIFRLRELTSRYPSAEIPIW